MKFIIYSPPFDENSGGAIALHRLCHILNEEKQTAFLWKINKSVIPFVELLKYIYRFFRYFSVKKSKYAVFEDFNTPIAKRSDLKNAIVIYPEKVNGNPLRAKNVVRWFLHKPGFHTGEINYLKNELYFYYQQAFNDEKLNPNSDNLLQTLFVRDDIYRQTNFGERKGTCYILRKGRNRKIIHNLDDSILIDDLSHKEIAKIFNSVEMCVSYDLYTLYSSYAVLCGCISVVVPQDGLSKEDWIPEEEKRYGVAYGFDDIECANKTKKYLLPLLKEQERNANATVKNLIDKCYSYFGIRF